MKNYVHPLGWISAVSLSLGLSLASTACTRGEGSGKNEPKQGEKQAASKKQGPEDRVASMKGRFDAAGKLIELPPVPEGPISLVGKVPVPRARFMELYELKTRKITGELLSPRHQGRMRKHLVERLTMEEMIRQEAEVQKVSADMADVKKQEDAEKARYEDWTKRLAVIKETEESWHRANVTRALKIALLRKSYQLTATEEELEAEYQRVRKSSYSKLPRVHAAHILTQIGPRRAPDLPMPEADPETVNQWKRSAKQRAWKLYGLALKEGADFAQLAAQHSHGPTAAKGGDLGIFHKHELRNRLALVAFSNKDGEVSDPFTSELGWHVLKTYKKYPPGELPRELIVRSIRKKIEKDRQTKAGHEFTANLYRTHRVDVQLRQHMFDIVAYMKKHIKPEEDAQNAPAGLRLDNDAVKPG